MFLHLKPSVLVHQYVINKKKFIRGGPVDLWGGGAMGFTPEANFFFFFTLKLEQTFLFLCKPKSIFLFQLKH